ncbi:ribonuclease Z [Virgibacillus alimentarius]|uniref:Ribonuclease Z n=1 Tax=Virgibacillus alimentarius TaxID=698769 RepID=A0ABS4S619_9BACI|nr:MULTISPECIES: ribonuclease Z [Virgibacillus]MBP2256445.1 ribonuclease Z [Virgibacillus alimentarius]HLR66390.1 ribonuclease Z [Virgibacillus sp.]
MELIFLGTGAGVPSKERNVSAVALTLLQELNSIWLFDCGEATQHQILHTTIKPRKINKIFITHMHGDHIFGLPGLLSSRSFQGGNDLLTVYGPPGIKEYIEMSLQVSQTHLAYPLSIKEIKEGQLFDEEHFTVYCKKLNHGIPSYGYRIVEKNKPGELLVDQLKAIGIPPGPIYKQIKENDMITLSNGEKLYRDHFLGKEKKGRILSILGDTRFTEQHANFVKHSDVLIHEATFDHEKKALAEQYFHSTTTQAAVLAKKAAVKKLILTHISSRYQNEDNLLLLNEAKAIFSNTELANDFSHMVVRAEH